MIREQLEQKEFLLYSLNNILNQQVTQTNLYYSGNADPKWTVAHVTRLKALCLQNLQKYIDDIEKENTVEIEYANKFRDALEQADWSTEESFRTYSESMLQLKESIKKEIDAEAKELNEMHKSLEESETSVQLEFVAKTIGEAINFLKQYKNFDSEVGRQAKNLLESKFQMWLRRNKGPEVRRFYGFLQKSKWEQSDIVNSLNTFLGFANDELSKLTKETREHFKIKLN